MGIFLSRYQAINYRAGSSLWDLRRAGSPARRGGSTLPERINALCLLVSHFLVSAPELHLPFQVSTCPCALPCICPVAWVICALLPAGAEAVCASVCLSTRRVSDPHAGSRGPVGFRMCRLCISSAPPHSHCIFSGAGVGSRTGGSCLRGAAGSQGSGPARGECEHQRSRCGRSSLARILECGLLTDQWCNHIPPEETHLPLGEGARASQTLGEPRWVN